MGGEVFIFPCGCCWPVLGPPPVAGAAPLLDLDLDGVPEDCPAVWRLLAQGRTKGVFQLEGSLGKKWTRRLRPESLEHLSALVALVRPGPLEGVDDRGVSMTENYCRRKNQEEEVRPFHPAVDPILHKTYGVLVYQESLMRISRAVAHFTDLEVDQLRKAVGKKLQDELAKVKTLFLKKSTEAAVISVEQANLLWAIMEKSGRYCFNKAHSVAYGSRLSYKTAYLKAHLPAAFFVGWLSHARQKKDGFKQEVRELVDDARSFGVRVGGPDARRGHFSVSTDGLEIWMGLGDVKGVGESTAGKLVRAISSAGGLLGKPLGEFSGLELLCHVLAEVPAGAAKALIGAGAFPWLGNRKRLLAADEAVRGLTKPEFCWLRQRAGEFPGVVDGLRALARPKKEGGGVASPNRGERVRSAVALLERPPSTLEDSPRWLAAAEEEYLGASLSCLRTDGCDLSEVTCTAAGWRVGAMRYATVGLEIRSVRERLVRNGQSAGKAMGALTGCDHTGLLEDIVVWPEAWERLQGVLREGRPAVIRGERTRTGSLSVLDARPAGERELHL